MPDPATEVLAEVERIVEATPSAYGQRMGLAISRQMDESLRAWLVAECRGPVSLLASLGYGDLTEEVLRVAAKAMRRLADGIEG